MKKALSIYPKDLKATRTEGLRVQRRSEAKAKLMNQLNELQDPKKGSQRIIYCNNKEDRPKTRKQKIGSTLKGVKNQAASNINLNMNFYSMEPKGLHTRTGNLEPNVGFSCKEIRLKDMKVQNADQTLKDSSRRSKIVDKSNTRIGTQNISTNKKAAAQFELNKKPMSTNEKRKRSQEPTKKQDKSPVKDDKWQKITKLMKNLKTKLEKEDPDKVKIFKNIEKILKHVKKQKEKRDVETEKSLFRANMDPDKTAILINNKKYRERDIQQDKIDNVLRDERIKAKKNHREFLTLVQGKTSFKDTKEVDDTPNQCRLISSKALELHDTNNYFFLPKKDSVVQKLNDSSNGGAFSTNKANNRETPRVFEESPIIFRKQIDNNSNAIYDQLNLLNPSPQSFRMHSKQPLESMRSLESKPAQRSLRVYSKQDMDIWATPSKNSVELLTNELGLRVNKSIFEEKNNKSLKNSMISYHARGQKGSEKSSLRLDSLANFSKELRNVDKQMERSCKEFDQNVIPADGENSLMFDSIFKPPVANFMHMDSAEQMFGDKMTRSWNDIQQVDKAAKSIGDSLSYLFYNRSYAIEHNNNVEKELLSDSKAHFKKKAQIGELASFESTTNDQIKIEYVEACILNNLFDCIVKDQIFKDELITWKLRAAGKARIADDHGSASMVPIDEQSEPSSDILLHQSDVSNRLSHPLVEPIMIHDDFVFSETAKNDPEPIILITDDINEMPENTSVVDQSGDTIYAIRTHFNAIHEYLLILTAPLDSSNEFNIKKLVNNDRIENLTAGELLESTRNLQSFNKHFYESLYNLVMDQSNCELLFSTAENDILAHCNNLAAMSELVAIQRSFHRSVFDCLMYNFAKIVINSVLDVPGLNSRSQMVVITANLR